MDKIRVDFNRRNGLGELVSSSRRAERPVSVGDILIAYQPGEPDMDSTVEVTSVEDDGRVTLNILQDNPDAINPAGFRWRTQESPALFPVTMHASDRDFAVL